MAEIVQLGKFDDPNPPRLRGCAFAAEVRQFVGEVLAGDKYLRCKPVCAGAGGDSPRHNPDLAVKFPAEIASFGHLTPHTNCASLGKPWMQCAPLN